MSGCSGRSWDYSDSTLIAVLTRRLPVRIPGSNTSEPSISMTLERVQGAGSVVLGWSTPVCVGPRRVRQAAMVPHVGKNQAEWGVQHVPALHAYVVVDPDPYSSDAAAV